MLHMGPCNPNNHLEATVTMETLMTDKRLKCHTFGFLEVNSGEGKWVMHEGVSWNVLLLPKKMCNSFIEQVVDRLFVKVLINFLKQVLLKHTF